MAYMDEQGEVLFDGVCVQLAGREQGLFGVTQSVKASYRGLCIREGKERGAVMEYGWSMVCMAQALAALRAKPGDSTSGRQDWTRKALLPHPTRV